VIDDELNINASSTEADLLAALPFFLGDDPEVTEGVFEEARRRVPMPEAPKAVMDAAEVGAIERPTRPALRGKSSDRSRFDVFK
jgi:hypothetical protein